MVKHAIECTKLQLSGPVHGLPVFGEGHEAAHVVKPRSLLEGERYWSRSVAGFGDGAVDWRPQTQIGASS